MNLSKEEYVSIVKELREVLKTDENSKCSCPNAKCELHGDCYNCIRAYRYFGHDVPWCLQSILEKKIAEVVHTAEALVQQRRKTPDEYFDYLNVVAPKEVQPGG